MNLSLPSLVATQTDPAISKMAVTVDVIVVSIRWRRPRRVTDSTTPMGST
ncbi:MAG: hypothetical protein ABR548_06950 [Actinomycetota bacterium]|nr:hypothetical protein [Actinomycetota bacterium]